MEVMSGLRIRPMLRDDIPQCVRIVVDWINETAWMKRKDGADQIEPHFQKALRIGRTVLVAETDTGIAGYMSLDDSHYIQGIYVAGDKRGTGVGKALIAAAKERYPDYLDLGVACVNLEAQRFYEREGFVPASGGEGFDPDLQLPVRRMRWWGYRE